jgi:predicted DsbA family dithiol-disulfide isomerase
MATTKRDLLKGGLAIAVGYSALRFGAPAIIKAFSGGFQFEDIDDPSGFRQMTAGESSISLNPLFGIQPDRDPKMEALIQSVRGRVCSSLFGYEKPVGDTVRVAYFSDYNCPFCRVLTPIVAGLEKSLNGQIVVSWHELPLLGDLSVLAAKAALAAKRQGAYVEFNALLMRPSFLKTPEYIQRMAKDLGIDGDQLAKDMQSPEIIAEIQQSIALSKIFGFIGTPVLVVGATVVQGRISKSDLEQLIDRERADGPNRACI